MTKTIKGSKKTKKAKKKTGKKSKKKASKKDPQKKVEVPPGNNGQMGPTKPELIHGSLTTNEDGDVVLLGRPVKYIEEYPELLVRHMCNGHSFWSFAAVCDPKVCRRTLQYWLERYPEFLEAREIGRQGDLMFLEEISKAGMTGTLRRISEEKIVKDAKGQPVLGNNGQPLTEKKYSQARYCPKTWSLLMKNRHNFAEKVDVKSKNYTATKKLEGDMTDSEIEEELKELADWEKNFQEDGDN